MRKTIFDGVKGVFLSDEEFNSIKDKISANQMLIAELCKEVGIDDQTI